MIECFFNDIMFMQIQPPQDFYVGFIYDYEI